MLDDPNGRAFLAVIALTFGPLLLAHFIADFWPPG
jgi:hypothetical protein